MFARNFKKKVSYGSVKYSSSGRELNWFDAVYKFVVDTPKRMRQRKGSPGQLTLFDDNEGDRGRRE